MKKQSKNSLAQAALTDAGRGWFVIPLHGVVDGHCTCPNGGKCSSPGKHPRIKDWQQRASTDPKQIDEWWTRWPDANIGIVTGKISGLLVIDVDPRHGGNKSLDDLFKKHGKPKTYVVGTGGGGLHLYFQYPKGETE